MKVFDAIVFDMDGVIFDSERAVMNCWIELADRHQIPNIERPYLACTGTTKAKTKEIMLETYGPDFPYDLYEREASQMYHKLYDGGKLPMKQGVFELLEYLKQRDKRVALASSTRHETVVNQLRDAKILGYFDAVISGEMVARSKPEPDIYTFACETIHVEPRNAYAIEDSYNGIRSAHAAGLRPIMVPDLLPSFSEMEELSEAILGNLEEVRKYLEK